MRLRRLDLTRYGKFTDFPLDFGLPAPGAPDIHVVYGPNEAGKSTALAAFLDLLFGIELRSAYDFLHPYGTMQVGAALEWDGESHEFARVKRNVNSLLGPGGQPVPETPLKAALAGIDRSAYRTMFSLDDETLERGGDDILESRGDLGQLLFSASAGLADLGRTLGALQAEAENFHKPRAHRTGLSLLKSRLGELKAKREGIDTLASTYAQLVAERNAAAAAYGEAAAQLSATRLRTERIARLLAAHTPWLRAKALAREAEALAALPEPPPHWTDDLPELQREEIELETRRATGAALIERLDREIAAIAPDGLALGLATRFRQLGELAARAHKAEQDLPGEQAALAETGRAVGAILRKLGREVDDPAALLVPTALAIRLRALVSESGVVGTKLDAARREAAVAADRLKEAEAALPASGPLAGVAAVKAALQAWRGSDAAARRRLARQSRDAQAGMLGERLLRLAPWQGEPEALAALSPPSESRLEAWALALREARNVLAGAENERRRLEGETASLAALLEADRLDGVGDAAEARAARARRDEAWAAHRSKLDGESAERFEQALRQDDRLAAAHLARSLEAARHAETARALALATAALHRAGQAEEGARQALASLEAQIDTTFAEAVPALPQAWPLDDRRAWAARREHALEAWSALRAAERDLRDAEAEGETLHLALAEALRTAGAAPPAKGADALLAAADALMEREAELRAAQAELEARRRDAGLRRAQLEEAEKAQDSWRAAWAAACASTWLGAEAKPEVARAQLDAVTDLAPLLDKQAGLAARIARLEADRTRFAAETAALGLLLGIPRGEPMAAFEAIGTRVRGAELVDETRRAKLRERDAAVAEDEALSRRAALHERRVEEIAAFFRVGSLTEAGRMLAEAARRRALAVQHRAALSEAAQALGEAADADRESELAALDPDTLKAEAGELKSRLDTQEARAREFYAAQVKAAERVESVGGDDAVARIEAERRTVLLEIEDQALNHLRLRVGIAAAEAGLRAYRDAHRSSMMERASEAFRTISRGAYSSLGTQPGREGDVLVGIAAGGGSKLAQDMSKGTRFQLYLALRVAGYHEFARARPPVPFIADDIMETFDDLRAEEAFRLFAGMAEVGQVIYLTHHRHLCDIAREVCPGVRVHELPGGP